MPCPIRRLLFALGLLLLLNSLPISVEGAAAFFFVSPRTAPTYYQPYYRTPVNSYYGSYSPYADQRVYTDPRSTARMLQNSDTPQDYYQQYQDWWKR